MFDIGMFELLLIFILVLLVLGPERLPEVARMLGALSAKLRRTVIDLRTHVEREVTAHELQQRIKAEIKTQIETEHQDKEEITDPSKPPAVDKNNHGQ